MTNLEWILKNFKDENRNSAVMCKFLYCAKYGKNQCGRNCVGCEFNNAYDCFKCLEEEHKEPITKLTKVQYEILKCLQQDSLILISNNELIIHKDNLEMFMNKLGVKIIDSDNHEEKSIKIKDILEKCEVVE